MDPLSIVAVAANLISAAVAFLAGLYSYNYMQHTEKIFILKEKTPFLTIGLIAFGIAAFIDAISIIAGVNMTFTIGTIIRMIALIYILGGSIELLKLLEIKGTPEPAAEALHSPEEGLAAGEPKS